MPNVHEVIVTLRNPKPDDPMDVGQVTYGYYVVQGSTLTMTDEAGAPVRRYRDGGLFIRKLEPGEDPRRVAGRLTREIREMRHGDDLGGFHRRLSYGPSGIV